LLCHNQLVRASFNSDIAERILSIPLSSAVCPDYASWPTASRVYTLSGRRTTWYEWINFGRVAVEPGEVLRLITL
jgi:hypothetical protein